MNVLFVCVANSGRSVIAERLFREAAQGRHQARSAGSDPGPAPHQQVLEVLSEIGIDASDHVPRKLDQQALDWADVAVSTCSEEVCPVTPGVRRISWVFDDPKNLPLEQVRAIRDEIEAQRRRPRRRARPPSNNSLGEDGGNTGLLSSRATLRATFAASKRRIANPVNAKVAANGDNSSVTSDPLLTRNSAQTTRKRDLQVF